LVVLIIAITIAITGLLLFVPPLAVFFRFAPLSLSQLLVSVAIGFVSVIWFEAVKLITRSKAHRAA